MGKWVGELTGCVSKRSGGGPRLRGGGCGRAAAGLRPAGGRAGRGRGGGGHLADAAEDTELRRVKLNRLQVTQVRPSAEQGRGRDDERRILQNLILRGAGWRAVRWETKGRGLLGGGSLTT